MKLSDVIADLTRNPVSWFTARAVSTDPVRCVMSVMVSGVQIDDVPYLSSVAPVSGCEVHILSGALGMLVIGSTDRRTSVAGVVTVPGTAPPALITPPAPSSLKISPTEADSMLVTARGDAYWAGVSDHLDGDLGGRAVGGFWFYPTINQIDVATVIGITITVTRLAERTNLPPNDVLQPLFQLHRMTGSGEDLYLDDDAGVWLGPEMQVGQTLEAPLPIGWATALLAHTARGVVVTGGSRNGTMGAARLKGLGAPSGDLAISYLTAA